MSSANKANAALAAALIFLLLSTCAACFAFLRLRTSQHWVQHTRDVQLSLHRFATTATRAGRLRAQYADSGDESLLARQADAVVAARSALSSIQQLTTDNATQQASFRQLSDITDKRVALLDHSIQLRRAGQSTLEAQNAITRQITAVADQSDAILESMNDEEQRLLAQREQRAANSFDITAGVLASSLFCALVLFLIHHQLLSHQVRERFRAEAAQRALSARLLTLQDQERRRFARELHDSVGQHLAAMKMALSILQTKAPNETLVQDCLQLADDSITETRTISHLLHPPLLDEAGLNSAARWFVEGFAARSGIDVHLQIQERLDRFSEEIELVLFRVLQEGLTNIHRHSGAKRADVNLFTEGNEVLLRIRDYGRGIPQEVLQDFLIEGATRGVGLAGMKERVREVEGQLEIRSTSPGSELLARIPIQLRPPIETKNMPAQQEVGG